MNDTIPALEQFIEPTPVGFSADAPGWYVSGILLILVLLVVAIFILKHYRKNRYRTVALHWLKQEEKKQLENNEFQLLIYTAAMLVKRICINLGETEQTASLRGPEWISYLNKTCPSASFSPTDAITMNAVYDTNNSLNKQQVLAFTTKIKHWIQKHRIRP